MTTMSDALTCTLWVRYRLRYGRWSRWHWWAHGCTASRVWRDFARAARGSDEYEAVVLPYRQEPAADSVRGKLF